MFYPNFKRVANSPLEFSQYSLVPSSSHLLTVVLRVDNNLLSVFKQAEEHHSGDEEDSDDDVPAVGWVERRKIFFRRLITSARSQLSRLKLDPDDFQ